MKILKKFLRKLAKKENMDSPTEPIHPLHTFPFISFRYYEYIEEIGKSMGEKIRIPETFPRKKEKENPNPKLPNVNFSLPLKS